MEIGRSLDRLFILEGGFSNLNFGHKKLVDDELQEKILRLHQIDRILK